MTPAAGLDGIVALETSLCSVDGTQGQLLICGHEVEILALRCSFEGVCALLWGEGHRNVRDALGSARARAFERLGTLGGSLELSDGMDALRASVAQLTVGSDPASARYELTGALAVYAAAWSRLRQGHLPISPTPGSAHAADFLRMLRGESAPALQVAALDSYWVTMAEHDLMASTFAARVIASTGSDEVSSVVGALGALKGPAHGGAPAAVLDMIERLSSPAEAEGWVRTQLDAGRRIMGMGHRVYRTRDPRAGVIEGLIVRLIEQGVPCPKLEVARAVEAAATRAFDERRPGLGVRANVEMFAAPLLDALGIPRELFTPMYACSCVAGWLAHVKEQLETGRMIRPRSRYVAPQTSIQLELP